MASRPLLYSMDISHYCVAADRMLAFKGVSFDTRYVPYHDKRELIKATGQDYVPTLRSAFSSAVNVITEENQDLEKGSLKKSLDGLLSFSLEVENLRQAVSGLLAKQEKITGTPPPPLPEVKLLRVGSFKGVVETLRRFVSGHGLDRI